MRKLIFLALLLGCAEEPKAAPTTPIRLHYYSIGKT